MVWAGFIWAGPKAENQNAMFNENLDGTGSKNPKPFSSEFAHCDFSGSSLLLRKMNHIAAMEEQVVSERMRQKLNEVNMAAQSHLGPVQDHVNFTLQQAYFKCAYECFDRRRRQEEISNCVENCSVPVIKAQQHVENEMAKFQERLNRSLMVCQDKFEAAKLQQKSGSVYDLESCVDGSIQESLNMLPHLADKLRASFNIRD